MKSMKTVITLIVIILLSTSAVASSAYPTNLEFVSARSELVGWIVSRQFTDISKDSYGAIRSFKGLGVNGYLVIPYHANLGLLGLLESSEPDKLVVTKRWIEWYLAHIGENGAQPGMVRDYWYQADGTDGDPLSREEDASDSYAATLLGLVWAYYQKGGDADFLRTNKSKIRSVAQAIIVLQQDDGLTWAKDSYPVKYLMDNSEVFWGLQAMAKLEQVVFNDALQAQSYLDAAERVRKGIQDEIPGQPGTGLYDQTSGLYHWAKHLSGDLVSSNLDKWYADTVALIWPQLFGVTSPSDSIATDQWEAVNEHWPDWMTSILTNNQLFPQVGYAALRAGDCDRAWTHARFVMSEKIPNFDYPFSVGDAGWLLRTLLIIEDCHRSCSDSDNDGFGYPGTDISQCSGSTTAEDNCPDINNPDQTDTDGDRIGDSCDIQQCGNGVIEDQEGCDDGNLIGGDGCSSTCQIEADCVVHPSDLLRFWPGDDTTEDIIHGHSGALHNGAFYTDGYVDKAFSLDGVDDYIEMQPNQGLDNLHYSDFSVSAWIYPEGDSTVNTGQIVQKRTGFSGWRTAIYHEGGNRLVFWAAHADTAMWILSGFNTLNFNEWNHITVVYDSTSKSGKTYINGIDETDIVTVGEGNPVDDSESPLIMGSYQGTDHYFDGIIDEVVIIDRALSEAEINEMFNAQSGGMCKGPCIDPDIDGFGHPGTDISECSASTTEVDNCPYVSNPYQTDIDGDRIGDSCDIQQCGNGVIEDQEGCDDGNLIGGDGCSSTCQLEADCVVPPSDLLRFWPGDDNTEDIIHGHSGILHNGAFYTDGYVDKAFSLDGVDDYIEMQPNQGLDNLHYSDFSVSAWIFPEGDSTVNTGQIVQKRTGFSGWRTAIYHEGGNKLVFWAAHADTAMWILSGYNTLNFDEWNHITVVYDSTSKSGRTYINGIDETDIVTVGEGNPVDDSASPLIMGSYQGTDHYFDGIIDEVVIIDRALSEAEISEMYNAQSGGMCKVACIDPDNDGFGDPGTDLSACTGSTTSEDNCPYDANPNQADNNGDGIGDTCESEYCGATIYEDTDLLDDIFCKAWATLTIGADDITLNCKGHSIGGNATPNTLGVYLNGRQGVTVTNCVIEKFGNGIHGTDSLNNVFHGNHINGNVHTGLTLGGISQDNLIYDNKFTDNHLNAMDSHLVLPNSWNLNTVGNYWDDYIGYRGYPDNYILTYGGTDYYPRSPDGKPTCGYPIYEDTYLNDDIVCDTWIGLIMGADNVTLDCKGHSIGGNATPNTLGVYLNGRQGVTVTNCVIEKFGNGIHGTDSLNNVFHGNHINGNVHTGLTLGGISQDNLIYDNKFTDNHLNAMDSHLVLPNSWNLNTVGNYWDDYIGYRGYPDNYILTYGGTDYYPRSPYGTIDCGYPIYEDTTLTEDMACDTGIGIIIGSDDITLDCNGHSIGGNATPNTLGVYLNGRQGVTVTNCVIEKFGNGIHGTDSLNNVFHGNHINGNVQTGLLMGGSSQDNLIYDNKFTDNHLNAIGSHLGLLNSWNLNTVGNYWDDYIGYRGYPDNYILTHGGTDYYPRSPYRTIDCGYPIYEDTTLTEDLACDTGIGLVIGEDNITLDCNGHSITGNSTLNTWGIFMNQRDGVTIKNCIAEKFGTGLYLVDSENNQIHNNIFRDNVQQGLGLAGISENNLVYGNIFTNNPTSARSYIYYNSWNLGTQGNYYDDHVPGHWGFPDLYGVWSNNIDYYPLYDPDGDGVIYNLDNCPDLFNPDQSDIDVNGSGDLCDVCPADFDDNCNADESTGENIDATGGTVEVETEKVKVEIPPGSLAEDTSISITGGNETPETDIEKFQIQTGSEAISLLYTIGPEGTNFNEPVTLTIRYDESEFDETTFDIYYYDPVNDVWEPQGADCDIVSNECQLILSHLSVFILGQTFPPQADAGLDLVRAEGELFTFDGSGSSDPEGVEDIVSYEWDFGDGNLGSGISVDHAYNDDGVYVATLTVTDSKGQVDTDSVVVTVDNIAPTIPLSGDVSVDEGAEYVLTVGTISDPGDDTVTEIIVHWGDDDVDSYYNTGDVTHVYEDGPVLHSITVDLVDEDGTHPGASSLDLTVNNVAPSILSVTGPVDPVNINDQPVAVEVTFSDPGADTHDITLTWGDDQSDTQYNVVSPTSFDHSYIEPGVYSVGVTVTDDEGGTATTIYEYIVIYDPDGGFVTGGGWIYSQPGWCQLDEICADAEGKANFGFVSKYKKGASIPTGNTEFNFKSGGLNLHSDTYQWLVVTGSNYARYKGSGTINGEGDYKFLLWAGDGTGEYGVDTFRIKIWYEDEEENEFVVYDNGFDQSIEGGNIKVHTNN